MLLRQRSAYLACSPTAARRLTSLFEPPASRRHRQHTRGTLNLSMGKTGVFFAGPAPWARACAPRESIGSWVQNPSKPSPLNCDPVVQSLSHLSDSLGGDWTRDEMTEAGTDRAIAELRSNGHASDFLLSALTAAALHYRRATGEICARHAHLSHNQLPLHRTSLPAPAMRHRWSSRNTANSTCSRCPWAPRSRWLVRVD